MQNQLHNLHLKFTFKSFLTIQNIIMKKIFICFCILFSTVILAQEKNNLLFKEGFYTLEIKPEGGKNYLELDKENKIEMVSKNIEMVNLSATAHNLKIIKAGNTKNSSFWIAIPTKEQLKDGFYALKIVFRGKKGKLYQHEFLIPVKEQ